MGLERKGGISFISYNGPAKPEPAAIALAYHLEEWQLLIMGFLNVLEPHRSARDAFGASSGNTEALVKAPRADVILWYRTWILDDRLLTQRLSSTHVLDQCIQLIPARGKHPQHRIL